LTGRLFVFGLGYSAGILAERLRRQGWRVAGTGRAGTLAFDDDAGIAAELTHATHVLSSVPPSAVGAEAGGDPVLLRHGARIRQCGAGWIGYLSSTGVYGDAAGAWVDESAPVGRGRRTARAEADLAWQALDPRARVPPAGHLWPGRSALERVRAGTAHRIDLPGQVFSRVHVEDIAGGIIASFGGPAGVYNLSDDLPCSQNAVIEEAARLAGCAPPPLLTLEAAGLSPPRAFYAENRRVANGGRGAC
jgi:hypothetical protein